MKHLAQIGLMFNYWKVHNLRYESSIRFTHPPKNVICIIQRNRDARAPSLKCLIVAHECSRVTV